LPSPESRAACARSTRQIRDREKLTSAGVLGVLGHLDLLDLFPQRCTIAHTVLTGDMNLWYSAQPRDMLSGAISIAQNTHRRPRTVLQHRHPGALAASASTPSSLPIHFALSPRILIRRGATAARTPRMQALFMRSSPLHCAASPPCGCCQNLPPAFASSGTYLLGVLAHGFCTRQRHASEERTAGRTAVTQHAESSGHARAPQHARRHAPEPYPLLALVQARGLFLGHEVSKI